MGMVKIMMRNSALRQMPSFFWVFFVIYKTHRLNTMRANFPTSLIQWLSHLHSGAGVGRQGWGVEGSGETRQVCYFWGGVMPKRTLIIQFSPSIYLRVRPCSSLLCGFWDFDHFTNISRLHWLIFCLRNIIEKNIQGVHYVPEQPEPPGDW